MIKTRVIRVFSFIMALTLVFAMISAPSYALDKNQLAAWVASALTALNITYNSTIAPYYQFLDYLSDPFQINESQVIEYVPYTYDDIDNILERNTISFKGEKVIIDGKEYQDIWLSHDAAEKFRVNAFDLKTAFDIASNSEGTYVSGAGYVHGVPYYLVNNEYRTQNYSVPSSVGTYKAGLLDVSVSNPYTDYYRYVLKWYYSEDYRGGYGNPSSSWPWWSYQVVNPSSYSAISYAKWNPDQSYVYLGDSNLPSADFDNTPFDLDWVSSNIPAEQDFSDDDGLHLRVPTDPSEWSDDPDAQQVINNFNDYLELNPDLAPDVDLDLDDPDILDKIGDLLNILRPIIDLLKPEFSPKSAEPDPPEPPVPPTGDLIPDTPWSYLENILNNIIQKLQNLWDKLYDILNINTGIKNSIDALREWLRGFENTLFTHITQIRDFVYNILQNLQNIVDKLLTHDSDWFKDIVDSIWNPFIRIFAIFKTHIDIWHYVVDWLSNISAPFTFFYSVLSGLGTIYTSPIFAAFSGILVIAIYRRFGR